MSISDPKDTFITQLLNETYQDQAHEEESLDSEGLLLYFQAKTKEFNNIDPVTFFTESGLTYFEFEFCKSSSCYRMNLAGFDIDIPCNWDLFSKLHHSIQNEESEILPLWNNEYSHFAEVLEAFFSAEEDSSQALLAHGSKIYLILLDQSNESHMNFFDSFSKNENHSIAA